MGHSPFATVTPPRAIPARLHDIAQDSGYRVEIRATIRRRGWPERSEKPYALCWAHGGHVASFATVEALERNLRARCGC